MSSGLTWESVPPGLGVKLTSSFAATIRGIWWTHESLVVLADIVSSALIRVPAETTTDGGVSVMSMCLVSPCPKMPVEP